MGGERGVVKGVFRSFINTDPLQGGKEMCVCVRVCGHVLCLFRGILDSLQRAVRGLRLGFRF